MYTSSYTKVLLFCHIRHIIYFNSLSAFNTLHVNLSESNARSWPTPEPIWKSNQIKKIQKEGPVCDPWKITAFELPPLIRCFCSHGPTFILCPKLPQHKARQSKARQSKTNVTFKTSLHLARICQDVIFLSPSLKHLPLNLATERTFQLQPSGTPTNSSFLCS